MLGLAASHLNIVSTSELKSEALKHRIYAVQGLSKALTEVPKNRCDSDAILATCYALAQQASYIGESIEEFLTMLHGCYIVVQQGWPQRLGSVFVTPELAFHPDTGANFLRGRPALLNLFQVDGGKTSLQKFRPLCRSGIEKIIVKQLLRLLNDIELRPQDGNGSHHGNYSYADWRVGFVQFSEICCAVSCLPQSQFQQVTDSSNPLMQILLAHLAAILALIDPAMSMRHIGRDYGLQQGMIVFRLKNIWNNVPASMRDYLDWPMLITNTKL